MEKNQVIFEVLQATGLNWTVDTKPLMFKGNDGGNIEIPNQFVTVRKDNEHPLGVVGNQYKVLQNADMVDMVYQAGEEVFDKDLSITHPWNNAETLGSYGNMAGGSLKGGSAVFVQLELPSAYIGKSDVKRYISITNHHDGSKALGFGTTNQVVCCANTFAIAHKELTKIRHTESMTARIIEATQILRRMLEFEEKQIEVFAKASQIEYTSDHVRTVMDAIFGKAKLDDKKPSTKLKNQVLEFSGDLETSISEQKSESLWTLFNAVTRYTNHTRGAKSLDKDYSLMFGTDASLNQKAYALIEDWVYQS